MADKTRAKSAGANFRSAVCFYREPDFSRAGSSLIAEREIMRGKSARGLKRLGLR
jgi:hypothetical protein